MYRYIFALLLGFFFLAPSLSFAQTPTCTIVYGGGEMDCEATKSANAQGTATPTPATGSASNTANTEQATKGGMPIYEPTPATETPATGPEMIGFAALIPAAALGFYLRNKKI